MCCVYTSSRVLIFYTCVCTLYICSIYEQNIYPKLTNNNKKKDVNIATGMSFIYGLFSSFLHSVFVSFSSFPGRSFVIFLTVFRFSLLYIYTLCLCG